MARVLAAFLCVLLLAPLSATAQDDFATMPIEDIVQRAPELHPAALYILAARLMGDGEGVEAANWMYAGQLRYRFMIGALGDAAQDERILFSALYE